MKVTKFKAFWTDLSWAKFKDSEEFWQLDISKKKFNYRQDAIETKKFFYNFYRSVCINPSLALAASRSTIADAAETDSLCTKVC